MTQIEDLIRQALAETPATVTTTDPLGALDRRVRRARRRLAAGAGVVAATVAAAVVVPLVVLGGHGSPNSVGIAHHHTPGTTPLFQSGAIWVSSDSDGRRWLLYSDGNQSFVGQVVDGGVDRRVPVELPADYVVAGNNVIWVIGGGDGGPNMSRLTAIDPNTGAITTMPFAQGLLSFATASGDALYVDRTDASGGYVDRFELRGQQIVRRGSTRVDNPAEIALSNAGHVWVQSGKKLVELIHTSDGLKSGATVDWPGDIFGPTGADSTGDSMWAYDGRIIGLTPRNLLGCVSCAEGYRLNVPDRPTAVITATDGALFAAVPSAGLVYYAAHDVRGSGDPTGPTLDVTQVITMAADPAGGVDYVDDQGSLNRWDPSGDPAAR